MVELAFFLLGFNFFFFFFWLGDTRWGDKLTGFQFLKASIVFIGLGSILFAFIHLHGYLQKPYNRIISNFHVKFWYSFYFTKNLKEGSKSDFERWLKDAEQRVSGSKNKIYKYIGRRCISAMKKRYYKFVEPETA